MFHRTCNLPSQSHAYRPGLYGFLIAYLAAPVAGLSLDSAHIVDFLHGVPEWLKYTAKGIVALPFTFHSINGLRHIAWDLGTCMCSLHVVLYPLSLEDRHILPFPLVMSVKAVYRTGYTVVAASIVSALALVAL
jgi:succinate dehydrogenase (ubiquinone) cytochrome b560 subunit